MKQRNGGASQDIMMNLLGESSDSGPELLNLPPLKGKKPSKKKKNLYGTSSEGGLCNLWTFFKIFFFLLLVCSVVVMAVISFWLSGQVQELKTQLQNMESKNLGSLESYQDLHSQIQAVNKSLQRLKTEDTQASVNFGRLLNEISKKIASLNSTTISLKEGLKAAPELKQISSKVPVISQSVASLGVDVKVIKTQVEELRKFKKTTEEQLQHVVQTLSHTDITSPATSSGDNSVTPDFQKNTLQNLKTMTESLAYVNTSLWNQLSLLQKEIGMHQTRFVMLENTTQLLQTKTDMLTADHASVIKPVTGDGREHGTSDNQNIKDTVQKMINDMGLQNLTAKDSRVLDSLLNNMDNITSAVQTLRKQFAEVIEDHKTLKKPEDEKTKSTVSPEDIEKLQTDMVKKIEAVNQTVKHLLRDVKIAVSVYTETTEEIANLTSVVDGIKAQLLGKKPKPASVPSTHGQVIHITSTKKTTANVPTQTTTTTMFPVTSKTDSVTTQSSSSGTLDNTTEAPSTVTKTRRDTTTEKKHVEIDGIKDLATLELKFSRWDHMDGGGNVDLDELGNYMAQPPSKEEMEPYDENHDGLYSIEEFKKALGL